MEKQQFLLTRKSQQIAKDNFRKRLTHYRKKQNMSQDVLAELSGLSTTAIDNYERKGNLPKILTIAALANALNIPPCALCPLCASQKEESNRIAA